MTEGFVIKKILLRKDGVKYIIIPKLSDLNEGDYVMITQIKKQEVK